MGHMSVVYGLSEQRICIPLNEELKNEELKNE